MESSSFVLLKPSFATWLCSSSCRIVFQNNSIVHFSHYVIQKSPDNQVSLAVHWMAPSLLAARVWLLPWAETFASLTVRAWRTPQFKSPPAQVWYSALQFHLCLWPNKVGWLRAARDPLLGLPVSTGFRVFICWPNWGVSKSTRTHIQWITRLFGIRNLTLSHWVELLCWLAHWEETPNKVWSLAKQLQYIYIYRWDVM